VNVPGPGAYEDQGGNVKEAAKNTKFGSDQRSGMAARNAKFVPGPGHVSPDFRKVRDEAPKFGFGSEDRKNKSMTKNFPGPGNYTIPQLVGNETTSKSMHATIKYSPEKRENSYKPGPGNYDPDNLKVKK